MTTPMLLAFDRRRPTVVYDRLHRFSGHGYVAKVPNDVKHDAFDPNKPDVFVLADKGVVLARDVCGSERAPVRAQDIRHCLANAEFVLSLMLALDAAGEIIDTKIIYLGKARQLRLADEEFLDVESEIEMLRDGKRMARELMAKQHELQMVQLEAQIQQVKAGMPVTGVVTRESFEEKLRRLPTLREKMFFLAAEEKA
jgi:hypothetical protein